MKRISFLNYLLAMAVITVILGVVYATVQQSYRTAANDPQIQIARDIDIKLQEKKTIDNFFEDTIDIAQSLSIVAILYDANGKPIRSSGYLNGKMPQLPAGVFDYTKAHHEYAVTWQPQKSVRMAMVIISTNASPVGFVATGRSLQEVEVREHNLVTIVFIGWIICIGLVLLYAALQFYRVRENKF